MPNESLIHADIFFFISTIALGIISIAIIICSVYIIRTLSDIRFIISRWKEENEYLIRDARAFRDAVRSEGIRWKYIADKITAFFEHLLKVEHRPAKKIAKKK
ncbi:MAG: hypothetical protein WC767_03890 [Candidatus Paceibacterota bacterium]|jgi:hypothetical protein